MGVQIAQLKGDSGIRRQWLGYLRSRQIIVFERAIRERSQLAGGARRHETNVVFPKLESGGQSLERGFNSGPGRRNVVVVPCERKRHAEQQVQRDADHEVGLVRFDFDKTVHHPVERQIVGPCRDRTYDRAEQPNGRAANPTLQHWRDAFAARGSGQEAPLLGRWEQSLRASNSRTLPARIFVSGVR